jgi:3-dehydroquinate synthase
MKIVLTGFMGTGKTSVGMALSRMLGWLFVDTDALIEAREGMAISAIFKEKGEDYFREVERAVVRDVSQKKDVVIATGGGIIKDKSNVNNLGRRGVIIWLKTDPEIILRRIMAEGGKRPLLNVAEPLNEINRLLSEREALYAQADAAVDTSYITPSEAAEEIIDMLCLDAERVKVDLGERSYDIIIGRDILPKLGLLVKHLRPSKTAIISNKTIFPLYEDKVAASMKKFGISYEVFLLPDGEEYKDFLWVYNLHGKLLEAKFDRNSLIIAFGGGVVGDMAGFVAATYMRGIKYVQVPTTLLAQVDSSVGGKTGVNHPLGKNMIGAFYQPSFVCIDVDTLNTLPIREFCAGMAEVIKYGVIADSRLFDYLTEHKDEILSLGGGIVNIIKRSCEIKADVVSKDERESGLRAILNFGHTIGHAIETVTDYKKYLHGEAIAIGMCLAAELAVKMKIFTKDSAERIKALVEEYELPSTLPKDISVTEVMKALSVDKKAASGRLKFILPEAIGKVRIEDDIDREMIKEVLELHA